jgi:hypothetical protein
VSQMRRARLDETVVPLDTTEGYRNGKRAAEAPASTGVGEVLREWRAAERALAELAPGTPEWTRALRDVELLRIRYQQVFSAAEPLPDAEATG